VFRPGLWLSSVIRHALASAPAILTTADRLALMSALAPGLSPIDRHILSSALVWGRGLFDPSYEEWRIVRINKVLEILGIEFFKGKKVLELGCGHGDIGAFFASLGSNVVGLDGRAQNVNYAKMKHRDVAGFECHQFNLEEDFSELGQFDLIIHFGLLYHLRNIEKHLKCCFSLANDMILETVVCDSLDPYRIQFCEERIHVNEEALSGIGSRPSPFYVERIARENGFESIRYFSQDLNIGDQFVYDWPHNDDDSLGAAWRLRRFWRLKRCLEGTVSPASKH
jgi:SAM-dependent methyltransferase